MTTVQNVDVRVGYVHTVKNVKKTRHNYYTMATDADKKKDLTPPHPRAYSRGIPQKYFLTFNPAFLKTLSKLEIIFFSRPKKLKFTSSVFDLSPKGFSI